MKRKDAPRKVAVKRKYSQRPKLGFCSACGKPIRSTPFATVCRRCQGDAYRRQWISDHSAYEERLTDDD